ncbi:MAG: hypoxanthine phosphoribosyltransferase [Deltaproteobacteria bacterium]|nr:hypoxanthine phosphoribosyltransferase [Deltaproteobacteria bacterium]
MSPTPSTFISAEKISARVRELATAVTTGIPPGPLTVVGVLRGSFIFTADLVRNIERELACDFLTVRSYGDATVSSGVVEIVADLASPIADRHVLLVEDIVDTGLTLKYLTELLIARSPASLQTCALLSKPSRRRTTITIDHVGFEIEDRFVVGYGMDAAQRFRNLPYIGTIDDPQVV